jgi:hypothetical protein
MALGAQRPVSNRVDTPLNAAELPTRNPALDRSSSHPQLKELPAGDDAMLPLGKFSNAVIDGTRRQFSMSEMGNRRFVVHAPMLDGRGACVVR